MLKVQNNINGSKYIFQEAFDEAKKLNSIKQRKF